MGRGRGSLLPGESIAWDAMTSATTRRPLRASAWRLLLALACVAALAPTGVAAAQGSGVGLGSAKKLSSAPPSTSAAPSTSTSSTSTATSTTTSATSSASAHAKQLPFTGANVPTLVLIGGALLLTGLALRMRTRDARSR